MPGLTRASIAVLFRDWQGSLVDSATQMEEVGSTMQTKMLFCCLYQKMNLLGSVLQSLKILEDLLVGAIFLSSGLRVKQIVLLTGQLRSF